MAGPVGTTTNVDMETQVGAKPAASVLKTQGVVRASSCIGPARRLPPGSAQAANLASTIPDYLEPTPRSRGARGLGPAGLQALGRKDQRRCPRPPHVDDPWLDASNISISVSGGEVTLSGTVESREAKHRAERLVEDLSGVTHVQNNLRVAKGAFP